MILKALALGFSAGIFCLGICYPLLAPFLLSGEQPSFRHSSVSLGLFMGGRLLAYLLFAALTGLAGRLTTGVYWLQSVLLPLLFLILGAALMLYGVFKNLPRWPAFCSLAGRLERRGTLFLFGFLAGLNLCPPFLLALSYTLTLGRIDQSLLFFLFFFLATSVFLLPFLLSSLLARFGPVRSAARITAVGAGGWFVYLALRTWL